MIAPLKPGCLEGPLCLASTAHCSSSPSSSACPLFFYSPHFLLEPIKFDGTIIISVLSLWLVAGLCALLLRSSLGGRVEFFSPVIYVSSIHMGCAFTHVHTYTYKFTETKKYTCMHMFCTCNPASHHTCHIHLQQYVMIHHSPMSRSLYNILSMSCIQTQKNTHHSHTYTCSSLTAFTHSLCDVRVTLDTGSPLPCGGCHVGMRNRDMHMTCFSQEDWAMFNVKLIHNRTHRSESWQVVCSSQ